MPHTPVNYKNSPQAYSRQISAVKTRASDCQLLAQSFLPIATPADRCRMTRDAALQQAEMLKIAVFTFAKKFVYYIGRA